MKSNILLKELVRDETRLKEYQLWFQCPVCKDKPEKEDRIIRHAIYVPFLPRFENGWSKTGDSIENISVTPSIKIMKGCGFHGFITKGNVEYWID